jgi:ferritin-like metal-binding protein YciE
VTRTIERRASGAKSRTPRSPKVSSLHELFLEELKDLYNAEQQLTKALPKMVAAATSPDLRSAFQQHLKETQGHVDRLDRIVQSFGSTPKGKKCKGMEGLVEEGTELMSQDMDDTVKDAGLIGAAQRVEHYEMAGYGTARAFAEQLAETEAVGLLQQTLDEEERADMKLTEIAERINMEAGDAGRREQHDEGGRGDSSVRESARNRKGQGR